MRDRPYTAEEVLDHGTPVVRLADAAHGISVAVAPSLGNRAWELRVGGENFLHFPHDSPGAIAEDRHLNGIPFLAPWANRMPDGFFANGRKYPFSAGSEMLRLDGNGIPIHGMLVASPLWRVTAVDSDATSAHVTCRLDFWKHPDLMANWPFAHDYEMTYRLSAGVLEVRVTVTNLSADRMPLAIGFHPYFQLPGVPAEETTVELPVRSHVDTDSRLIPTGATSPVDFTSPVSLKDHRFDDGFTDLVRGEDGHGEDGRAIFTAAGRGKRIEVAFGPKYQVAVVYAPPGQNYVCFEPMSAVTNGINLAHEGKYPELQTVPAGGRWTESFWIRPMIETIEA